METQQQAPWVDPELAAAGALLRERGLAAPPLEQAPVEQSRAAYDRIGAFLCQGSEPLAQETELAVPGPAGAIRCRLYLPDEAQQAPGALVYFHGGGFALGGIEGWHGLMRDLVRQSGVAAISVDYRRSPEHRFPAQFDEAVAVVRHFAAAPGSHGIDGRRLAIGGDSAGANLALAAACALRDAGEMPLRAMLLFYGVYSGDMDSDSWRRLGGGAFGLSRLQMEWIWSHYLQDLSQLQDWRATPLQAELRGLPPAWLHACSLDPLLDDSVALHCKLQQAGVAAQLTIHAGLAHGVVRHSPLVGAVRRMVADSAAALREALAAG